MAGEVVALSVLPCLRFCNGGQESSPQTATGHIAERYT